MVLHCPFCKAPEDERVDAVDGSGKKVLLIMFDCPFHFTFSVGHMDTEEQMQQFLDDWRSREGEDWLESVGPVMKARELRNIERSRSLASAS